MNKNRLFFYFLSFIEGASVMAAELLGAKMLAPYFGTSLYVWSSVLAVTLGGLAAGYFAGGVISGRKNTERNLYYILLASALFLMLMPFMAKEVMLHTARFDLLQSILISSLFFLFPPVFFMGMVSPMVVQCIISAEGGMENSGKVAGTVYAVSTLGGILSTFLLGFYIIPEFGLTKPAIIAGIILGIFPFLILLRNKNFVSLVFPLISFFALSSSKLPETNPDVKILFSSEGLLGQIIVADYPAYQDNGTVNGSQRILFVNRSTQTVVTTRNGEKSFFEYVYLISEYTQDSLLFGTLLTRPRALVLGLGGGSVANALAGNNFEVDAVELDERMAFVAKKYFDLSGKVSVHLDDARHFIGNKQPKIKNSEKYNLIVLDAFIGEVNPHHLFTKEFFAEIRSLLSDSGVFFINGNGYWQGMAGKGMRSVCKTLINSGFNVEVIPTGEDEDYRNLVFMSKNSNQDIGAATSLKIPALDMSDAEILTDDKPQLDVLNAEANIRWRRSCIKYFLSGYYSKQDMLLFK